MEEKEIQLSKPNRTSTDLAVFSSIEGFEVAQRMAKALYTSSMVPDAYRGDQNLGSCLIVLDLAARMGMNPLILMQNVFIVKGKPSFYGPFLIGLVNSSGLYKSRLKFEQVGTYGQDDYGYRAYATDWDGDKVYGPPVTIRTAVTEGWWASNKKWQNLTENMLRYRAGSFFVKANCPELTFGIPTREEVEDMKEEPIDIPPHEVVEVNVESAPVAEAQPVQTVTPEDDF